MFDDPHALFLLQLLDSPAETLHLGPVNLWAEMMLRVIAVVEEQPVVNAPVGAHSPCDRLIRISPVVTVVPIEIAEAVAQLEERQEETHIPRINEMDRLRRHDHGHDDQHRNKHRHLDSAPAHINGTLPDSRSTAAGPGRN